MPRVWAGTDRRQSVAKWFTSASRKTWSFEGVWLASSMCQWYVKRARGVFEPRLRCCFGLNTWETVEGGCVYHRIDKYGNEAGGCALLVARTDWKSMVFCCARITRGREDEVSPVAVGPSWLERGGRQAPGGRDSLPASSPAFIGTWWLWLVSSVGSCEDTTAQLPPLQFAFV